MSLPSPRPRIAVVLAAGQGTRMKSATPKILHSAAGKPLLAWVLDAARAARCDRLLVIVGHGADDVRARFDAEDITWVTQHEQLGTGHAVAQAAPEVTDDATLLILSGDVPLVTPATIERLIDAADHGWGAMVVATLDQPGSLGRVIARPDGTLERIVEAADATPDELAVQAINAGIYAVPAPAIFQQLDRLDTANAQGELYLTDAVSNAHRDGNPVALVHLDNATEALGVNDRADLARAHQALLSRQAERVMKAGVTLLDPTRTTIETGVEIGADTVVHPGVTLLGSTRIGAGVELHQGVWARDAEIADGAIIHPYSVLDGATVGPAAHVGPFARLRPGADLGEDTRVGNFVEIKNSRLGPGAKAGHLTYLGDADVGAGTNVGAGVVTCNYDGERKHRTTIGAQAFVGSDTMLVAPIEIGARATTGAGSVITQDVPDDALGVGRAHQRNISDWTRRKKRRRD